MNRINQRIKKIFDLLRAHPEGISGEDISRQLGVSSRTIRSDMKILQEELKERRVALEATPNKGYVMRGDERDLEFVARAVFKSAASKLESPDQRVAYVIRRLLENAFHDQPITQMDLADEMFVSLSTLKTHLNDAKKILEKYEIAVAQFKSQGIKLTGDEEKLRYCISDYVNQTEVNDFYVKIFSGIDMARLDAILKEVLCKQGLQLTDNAKANLCTHVAIAIHRSAIGKTVPCSVRRMKELETTFEYRAAQEIVEHVYGELGRDILYGEVYYIAQCLLASKKFLDTINSPDKQRVKETVDVILREVCDQMGIDLTDDVCLIDGLVMHLHIAMTRIRFQMSIRNELLETIKGDYPLAFQMGVVAGKVIGRTENLKVNENEIGYIALHFGAAMGRRGLLKDIAAKRAIIVCSAGLGMSILLKAKIAEHFNKQIHIVKVVPGYEVNEDLVDEVDLVLTTVPIDAITSDKIIRIHPLLKPQDIEKIERAMEDEHIDRICLQRFFRPDCFFDKAFRDKEGCLHFLTDEAVRLGLMTEITKNSVFEREAVSSTAIGSLTAIPHPIYHDADHTFISVLILEKPVVWDETLVQVVFLLNIAKDESALWETIFLKLYDYIKEHNGINSLLVNRSYEIFLREIAKMF